MHALTDSPPWRLTAEPYICPCITWNMGSFFQTTGNGQLTYFFVILASFTSMTIMLTSRFFYGIWTCNDRSFVILELPIPTRIFV